MLKVSLKWGLALVAVVLLAVLGVRLIQSKKAALAQIPPAKIYGVVVPIKTATTGHARLTLPYLAEVHSDSDVQIASKVTSRVEMIASSGHRVKKDEVVVRLDASDLKAKRKSLQLKIQEVRSQILAKQTDLDSLKKTHARNQELLDIQAISKDKFETETAHIQSLAASIQSLKSSIAALRQSIREIDDTMTYITIRSPMDGVVSKTFVAEGGIASGGKPLLSISGGSEKRLVVRVPDNVKPVAIVQNDGLCKLQFLNSTFHGLDEYSCQAQSSLAAGNRTEIKLVIYEGDGVLLPVNGVLSINGKNQVLVVDGDRASPVEVEIRAEGSEGLVVEGLKPGTEYAVAKPDILLKLMSGVTVIRAGSREQ